ncbi:MAG: alpha/beta hydrolase [Myxococcales bacterium]|nr:alpha/beta hydrolase [Myxococcales bacterium]
MSKGQEISSFSSQKPGQTLGWLLLRGLVRERRHWGSFPERLAESTRGPVLSLDLPGVGTERDRPSPSSIAGVVADLRDRFIAERGEGAWGILAPSFGGMIAMAWAKAHPQDFAHVAVCNTSTKDLGSTFQRFSPEALRTLLAALPSALLGADPEAREARILGLVCNTPHGRAQAAEFAGFAREVPIGVDVLVRQLWAASQTNAPASLSIPVTVMCSEGDRLCSPAISRALAARLGAALHVHPDAGHDLPLDDPDWVIARIVEIASTA